MGIKIRVSWRSEPCVGADEVACVPVLGLAIAMSSLTLPRGLTMCKRRHHTIGAARWRIFLHLGTLKKPVENRFV